MEVALVGFGETGSTITSLLIHECLAGKIHVLDTSDEVSGRLLDMQHAAAFQNIVLTLNQPDALSIADYIFFCAGVRNAKNDDRINVTSLNKELIALVFGKKVLHPDVKIIVVTNPVELISTWISEYFNHKICVIGTGTMLDTYRFKYLLSRSLNTLPGGVETLVLGEHGLGMTPIISQTKVKGGKITSLISSSELIGLVQELKDSASIIRKTEEATKFGVSECAVLLLKQFESPHPKKMIASIAVPPDVMDVLFLDSFIFLSL